MRRKIQLALVAGAVAAVTAVPATPASASEICNTGDPLTDRVVCGTYGLVGGLICKITKGQSCIT
ncbi:MAG TPA: hypothetical protein VG318_18320 [Actinomycetota bacterium]|nr:hypothetical protein [Actinomycetota bacterium]